MKMLLRDRAKTSSGHDVVCVMSVNMSLVTTHDIVDHKKSRFYLMNSNSRYFGSGQRASSTISSSLSI